VVVFSSASLGGSTTLEGTTFKVSLSAFVRAPQLLIPAIIVISAFFIEGSMDVWSVLFLRRTLGATALAGSGGFAAFGLAMALGRAFAARILFALGYSRTVLFSGLVSLVAGGLAVLTTSPVAASGAFLVLGFAVAAAAPAAFGIAGGWGERPAAAIAALTTVGYSGFVVGPPILGTLADRLGLRVTMTALLVATAGIAIAGVFSGERRRSTL
jgi:hypothetical protein